MIFKNLKAKKYNIYFLQYTHFVLKDENNGSAKPSFVHIIQGSCNTF